MAARPKSNVLYVTNRVVKFGSVTYPIQAISRVYTEEHESPRRVKFKTLLWGFVALAICAAMTTSPDLRAIGFLGLFVSACFVVSKIYRLVQPRKFWVLVFAVHGTFTQVVGSRSRSDIYGAEKAITEAFHTQGDANYSNTYVLNQGQMVNIDKMHGDVNR